MYEQEQAVKELNSSKVTNYQFPVVAFAGLFQFNSSVPQLSSMQHRSIELRLFVTSNGKRRTVDLKKDTLTAFNRSISQIFVVHENDSVLEVELTLVGDAIVNLKNLVVKLKLSQVTRHFHRLQNDDSQYDDLNIPLDGFENNVAHFYVFSHGNNGTEADMYYTAELLRYKFQKTAPDQKCYILCATSNSADTWNGVDVGGTRLANEIEAYYQLYLSDYSKVYFSIIGHSLGGLYIRYAVSLIVNNPVFNQRLEFINLMSISSPHLGARKPSGSAMKTLYKTAASLYMTKILGNTGKQLNLTDTGHDNIDKPLLSQMADPDSRFIQALHQFKFKTLAAATCYDMIVPHCTAAIMHEARFPTPDFGDLSFQLVGHSGFDTPHDYYSTTLDSSKTIQFIPETIDSSDLFTVDQAQEQEYILQDLKNLQQINWRRLHMQFTVMSNRQVTNGTVHGIVINKKSPISILVQDDNIGAVQCVDLLCRLLLLDHFCT